MDDRDATPIRGGSPATPVPDQRTTRWVVPLLVILGAALAGCLGPSGSGGESPDAEAPPAPARQVLLRVYREEASGNDGRSGAPGNTLMPSAHRFGDRLLAGIDNPWNETVRLAVRDGNTTRRLTLDPDHSVQHLQVGQWRNRSFFAYRDNGSIWLARRTEQGWRTRAMPTAPGTQDVSSPYFRSSDQEFILGYLEVGDQGTRYTLVRLTRYAPTGDPATLQVRRIAPTVPHFLAAGWDLTGPRIGILYSTSPWEVVYATGTWDDRWESQTVWQQPRTSDQVPSLISLEFADETPYGLLTPWPVDGRTPGEHYRVRLATGPDWSWRRTDVRQRTGGVPHWTPAVANGTLVFPATDKVSRLYTWNGSGAPTPALEAECRLMLPVDSGAREAIAVAETEKGSVWRTLIRIPDPLHRSVEKPCRG